MQRKDIKRRRKPPRSYYRGSSFFRHLIAIPLAGILSFFLGLVLLDQMVMPLVVRKGKEVEIPDVIGRPRGQAERMLSGRGLRLLIDGTRSHPTIPEGCILSQEPRPRTMTKKGRRIYVVLSTGRAQYEMIDVSEVSVREATLRLQQAGFKIGNISEEPSLIPKGVVISQDPKPGEKVTRGILVHLLVSAGEREMAVFTPDLVHLSLDEAQDLLEETGLRLGEIRRTPSVDYLPGTVIEQSPHAGKEILEGHPVDLVVSAPPDE